MTNPPYRLAGQFAAHAIKLYPYVATLLRLAFLESGNPRKEAGRARLFCLDERPPARIHVFVNRLPRMHRAGWAGPRASASIVLACFSDSAATREGPRSCRVVKTAPGGIPGISTGKTNETQ